MLEYFTYKKFKKNKEAKQAREEEAAKQVAAAQDHDATSSTTPDRQHTDLAAAAEASSSSHSAPVAGRPVLDRSDESFLQNLLAEDGPAPPLPPRVNVPELDWPSDDASSFQHSRSVEGAPAASTESQEESKEAAKKSNRFSQVFSRVGKKKPKHGDTLSPDDAKPAGDSEEEREKKDLSRVLDRLNLSATGNNNKVTALTDDSAEVLRKFTQIFKDLANGVPTAYDDLVNLIKDRDGAITKGFEKLPSGLQKLVTQLPDKITASIAPEVLAAAAKSQGMEAAAAQNLLSPSNLFKLITEPGALVAMLRAIVTTLQQRWPAFIGVNVLWSVALCLLMFVLWYCYKRGREERLEKEKSAGEASGEGAEGSDEQSTDVVDSDHRLEAPPSVDSPGPATTTQDTPRS